MIHFAVWLGLAVILVVEECIVDSILTAVNNSYPMPDWPAYFECLEVRHAAKDILSVFQPG